MLPLFIYFNLAVLINFSGNDIEREVSPPTKRPVIDLSEWKNQRVLARRDGMYQPGLIQDIRGNRHVAVLFDSDKNVVYFNDVVDQRSNFDIISDNSPMLMMVTINSKVCVRVNSEENLYYEGRVVDKRSQPTLYCVKIEGFHEQKFPDPQWVARAVLRLIQPPWFEDLAELPEPAPDAVLPVPNMGYPMAMHVTQHHGIQQPPHHMIPPQISPTLRQR